MVEYTPNARDADLSVSVWQLMALRSAKNDGLQVPAAAIHDAVMYQKGGEHAQTAERLVQEMLLEKQASDGSWQAENGEERNAGSVYSTSLAVLSLSVKYHYLPIYQK